MGITLNPVHIGDIGVDPPVFLAPMSGVTDQPFRAIVKKLGAGLVISEMIASHEMVRAARASMRTSTDCGDEYPMAVQLAGYDPAIMAEAARLNVDRGAAIIDINFGCPARKVVTKQCGSALMREPALAACIVDAVARAVDVPVTVKMRLGWDDSDLNAPDLAARCERAGARMITVHGRTRCQLYTGTADWAAIRPTVDAVSVPVIVNGDIDGPASIDRALQASGAAGVMIGRAVQGRPWRLAQAGAYLRTGVWPADPDLSMRRDIVLQHYEAILAHYGSSKGIRIGRKHLGWYVNGLPNAADARRLFNTLEDSQAVLETVSAVFDAAIGAGLDNESLPVQDASTVGEDSGINARANTRKVA
ncbi:tRNA dihydrouridine synthase DusB [Fodinicurvata sp. EGI_FJ10296]|uniref:tRNA dihydrouridine synthase DusB n=1 Tax=Fodinicurvata sp. EGI_FJ10296 TaxID=3231908 RepID=UPI00345469E1